MTVYRIVIVLLTVAHVWTQKDTPSIYSDGDFIIGGLFPVHEKGAGEEPCGAINLERGIQRLEAMRFAVQDVNSNKNLLPGIQLGVKILDTCSDETHALDQSLDFVMSTLAISQKEECASDMNAARHDGRPEPIVAVVGAAYSSVSIQIANLLRLFQVPQISYASTSAELSNKERFGYFMRTVPPDKLQAKALVDIVQYFNWTYVSTIASDGEYGMSGIKEFTSLFVKTHGQCTATTRTVSRGADEEEFKDIIKDIYKSDKARVVVLFVGQDHALGLLNAARTLGYNKEFIWLASDGWGNSLKVVDGNEKVAEGALTITLQSQYLKQFDDYFLNLTTENNKLNRWFDEYWQEQFDCQLNGNEPSLNPRNSLASINNVIYDSGEGQTGSTTSSGQRICTGKEKYKEFKQEAKILFVYDAVYAVAVALDKLQREVCGNLTEKLCPELIANSTMRTTLLSYIKGNRKDGKMTILSWAP